MNDEWWMPNDQWWMRTDECWMMNDEWWMMNDEPFPIPKENFGLLYRKGQDWIVSHPNRELCFVISKKTRLNLSPSQQRTLHRYIKKDKSEPFPMRQQRTLHCYIENYEIEPFPIPFQTSRHYFIPTENCDHQKRKNGLYPNQTVHCIQRKINRAWNTHPYRELCFVLSKKTIAPLLTANWSAPSDSKTWFHPNRDCDHQKWKTALYPKQTVYFSIPTENNALSYRKRQNWTVPHPNRELCIVISEKTRLNRSPCQMRTLDC